MNNFLKWTAIIGIFLVPFTPLMISSTMLFPFITGKAFFFRIVVEIVFAAYLILALRDPNYRPKKSLISLATLLFLLVVIVADVFGVNPNKSIWSNFERMEGLFMIVHLWMYFVVASSLLVKKHWDYFMQTSVGVSVIVAIYGILQVFGKIDIRQSADRIDGTLGNSAYLAVYMLLNIGFVLFLSLKEKSKIVRSIYAVIVLSQLFIIYSTATRGTMVGIFVAVFISSVIYAWKAKEDKIGRIVALAIVAISLITASSLYLSRNADFVKNNKVLSRLTSISLENARTKYIWPMAIKGGLERPILGYGQEGFNYVFNKNYNPKMWTEEQWFDRAHNVFLDWFVATGVLGLGLYLSLYALALFYIWKGEFSLKEKTILIGLIAGYAVHNMFVFDNISSYILFFSILAFIHSKIAKEYIPNINIQVDIRDLVCIPVVIIGMGTMLYFVNIVPINVSKSIVDGLTLRKNNLNKNIESFDNALSHSLTGAQEAREQIINASENIIRSTGDQKIQQEFFKLALKAIKDQTEATPHDARIYLLGGGFLNRLGQFNQAFPMLVKAHELSPKKQAPLFELALNKISSGSAEQGLEYCKQAYELDPNYPEAQNLYAISMLYAKKINDFNEIVKKHPTILEDQRVKSILSDKKYI